MRIHAEGLWRRLGTIIGLVEQAPQGMLGRTAIVKLLYLLQEVRGVPLGYDFRLYTYGPFDADVLSDIETAQSFQALHVKTVTYPSGYGYEVSAGAKAAAIKESTADWMASHRPALAWAATNFAARSASELELLATIVYAARELAAKPTPYQLPDLAKRVGVVKPRFSESYVLEKCREAQQLELLAAVT
jgi:uncharacterized protein